MAGGFGRVRCGLGDLLVFTALGLVVWVLVWGGHRALCWACGLVCVAGFMLDGRCWWFLGS